MWVRGRTRTRRKNRTTTGERSVAKIGDRLRISREALGLNQAEFARCAGLSRNAYSAYERGRERPSLDNAIRLKDAHSLTLDWIYDGDSSGLRAKLADAIKAILQARHVEHILGERAEPKRSERETEPL
jgi:transcriptional regulator with XRE-family HTH domain